ncbi:MAG: hypothetical protein R3E73_09240 [Porticoccaceae bacterium]
MEYLFKSERILLKEAIAFIAVCAYPNIDRAIAKKRVRTAVRSEGKQFVRFNKQGEEYVDAMEFFTWAVTKKKWRQGLSQVKTYH